MIRCVGRCLGLAVWTASSESRMCSVPVHEGQRRVGKSRLLTAPPWSPAGGRRVQSSVCGRRAQGLAGRTRRPGVAVAEGSGSSERRRRRVVAAVAARATCIDGLLTGGGKLLRPKARIRRTFLVYACWHQLKACPGAVLTAGREVCVAERKSHDMHEF